MKEQCESSDYVDLKVRKTGTSKRGKVFSALMPCYFKMTLLVATQDAAERMKRYMTTIVRKAEEVKIVQFFSRMHALNEMIEYLPCLKHVEDSPVDLPIMNVPFTELDMCTNILSALPVKMTVAYYASKGQHFPTSMKKLEEDLILVEAQVQRQDKMMQDLRSKAGISKGSDGKKTLKMKEGDPIPKKQRTGAGKQGPPNNEKGPTHKLCQLCAVHSPSIKGTHNTAQCRKWNADGSEKRRGPRSANSRNTNKHLLESVEDFKGAFSQMRKEIKSLRKRNKRKQKKRSKKRYYESSDDSSSSDSE